MHVLAVAPYVPYEGVRHAGGQYLLSHLRALAAECSVTLLAPESDEWRAHASAVPDDLDVVVAPLALAERRLLRRLGDAAYRRAMGVPPGPTAESLRAIRSAGVVERARAVDVVELHWPEYARFATELRRAGVRTPISVVEHDVDIEANARRLREYAAGYRRVLGLATARLPRRWEVRGLADADLVLVFKLEDGQLLRRLGISTPVQVIDPWLEAPPLPGHRRPASALFAGALWRRENSDGALWLLERVWPAVLERVPDAELVLAGAGPPPALHEAAGRVRGVIVTGEVPDLMPYYARASLFVAPMFVGGGLKFKVAQAMLCGLPVVATHNAAQGIVGHAPQRALWAVTDEPAATAAAVVEAFRDPLRAARTGATAARWAAERWSFERSMQAVVTAYRSLGGGRRPSESDHSV